MRGPLRFPSPANTNCRATRRLGTVSEPTAIPSRSSSRLEAIGNKMNKKRFIIVFSVTHLILTLLALVITFTLGMDRFDSGTPASLTEKVVRGLSWILMMPITRPFMFFLRQVRILGPLFSGLMGYILFFLNSTVCGFIAWWIYSKSIRADPTAGH